AEPTKAACSPFLIDWFWTKQYPRLFQPSPNITTLDAANKAWRHAVMFSQGTERFSFRTLPDFSYVCLGQFRVSALFATRSSSVDKLIGNVFFRCLPRQMSA